MCKENPELISNFCVCCGEPMPEGDMICPLCKEKFSSKNSEKSLIKNLWEQLGHNK